MGALGDQVQGEGGGSSGALPHPLRFAKDVYP